jgi:hypothetical protein
MGLKEFFSRWSRSKDAGALERAQRESQMTAVDRAVDQEDYEARKDDIAAASSFRGAEATEAASDDLESE